MVPPPPTPETPSFHERFAAIIENGCRAVAARGGRDRALGPMTILIWNFLRRIIARSARLASRPPVQRRRTEPAPRRPRDADGPARETPPPDPVEANALRLPSGRLWLIRWAQETSCCASQLRHLLDQPEIVDWLAVRPELGRLLRPVCHMLGVAVPAVIALPPRPKRQRRRPARPRPTDDRASLRWRGRRPVDSFRLPGGLVLVAKRDPKFPV